MSNFDGNMTNKMLISDESLNFIGNKQPKFHKTERKI